MSETETRGNHILMVPFMAQGHLRPFLQLAFRLQSRIHFTVTILTTPLNAHSLRQKLSTTTAISNSTIQVAELPFNPAEHGLPPNIDNLDKLPLSLFHTLFHASTSLKPHLQHYLSHNFSTGQLQPLCIIYDFMMGWVSPVAKSFGFPAISLSTASAYGTTAYISVWDHLPHHKLSDEEDFSLPGFPENHRFKRSQLHRYIRFADGSDMWSKYFQPQFRFLRESSGFLCNSVEEIEPLGLEIFRNYFNLPVWAIGPLNPISNEINSNGEDEECIKWLNLQNPDSVLYISFGSQNTISSTQMMELATGLELSGKPFLWVIRPPFGFDISGEFNAKWLPEGFEERMRVKNQGILVHKWGPQLKILRHKSTGGFMSHCGWNSILEALINGVPILGWPLAGEQTFNLRMLVEQMGVAMELTNGLEGKVSKEEVKMKVDVILEREGRSDGWEMKKKAMEVEKKLKDAMTDDGEYKGSSVRALDDFVDSVLKSL